MAAKNPTPNPQPSAPTVDAVSFPGYPRQVAFAKKPVRVYLGGQLTQVFGGEWIVEAQRVAEVARDPSFELITVDSPQHAEDLVRKHIADVLELREMAAALGFEVFRHGEASIPRGGRR
jgi:hypothetical protein